MMRGPGEINLAAAEALRFQASYIEEDRGEKVMDDEFKAGKLWKHYKGGLYQIVGVGTYESNMEPVVIYQSMKNNRWWVRTRTNFTENIDGILRFSPVEVIAAGEIE